MSARRSDNIERISKMMIEHYIGDVTVSWFNHHDLPPSHIHEYLPLVEWMKQNATNHSDLGALRLAFEYLLTTPGIDLEELGGTRYPYDAEDIREIIDFAYRTIWPERELPSEPPAVELAPIPLEEWWNQRAPGRDE